MNISFFETASNIQQRQSPFTIDWNVFIVFLFSHSSGKILFKYFRNVILYCGQLIIKVCLGKIKVLVSQLIDKSLVNLVSINILIFPAIIHVFYAVQRFHKADISGSIAYESTMVKYFLFKDIFIEVHIII